MSRLILSEKWKKKTKQKNNNNIFQNVVWWSCNGCYKGWIFVHINFFPYLSLNKKSPFYPHLLAPLKTVGWMTNSDDLDVDLKIAGWVAKQCRPRWDAAFCGVSSGSIRFAQACLSEYLWYTVYLQSLKEFSCETFVMHIIRLSRHL